MFSKLRTVDGDYQLLVDSQPSSCTLFQLQIAYQSIRISFHLLSGSGNPCTPLVFQYIGSPNTSIRNSRSSACSMNQALKECPVVPLRHCTDQATCLPLHQMWIVGGVANKPSSCTFLVVNKPQDVLQAKFFLILSAFRLGEPLRPHPSGEVNLLLLYLYYYLLLLFIRLEFHYLCRAVCGAR